MLYQTISKHQNITIQKIKIIYPLTLFKLRLHWSATIIGQIYDQHTSSLLHYLIKSHNRQWAIFISILTLQTLNNKILKWTSQNVIHIIERMYYTLLQYIYYTHHNHIIIMHCRNIFLSNMRHHIINYFT